MTQGFNNLGFRPTLAVEWDLSAAATYAANFERRCETQAN